MKISLASDLHFEFHKNEPYWLPEIAPDCDVIILAGDIGVGNGAIDAVLAIAEAHAESQVLFVAGNHEFYKQNIDKKLEKYRQVFADYDRVHFLENDRIEIDGYSFLGCTLWTGFGVLSSEHTREAMQEARLAIADFSVIETGEAYTKFTPQDAADRFVESCRWLKRELEASDLRKTVVVTHFPPCRQASNKFFNESLLSAYFQADCQQIIERFQPALWCYGHNHFSDELEVGHTHIVSNQLGYPKEFSAARYNPHKVIEL